MRHVLHMFMVSILASGILGTAVGCASAIRIEARDDELIAQAHTWTFLNHDPPIQLPDGKTSPEFTYRVTSPMRDARALDANVARFIEEALTAHGFERVETDADLYVDYQLTLQPRAETIEVPRSQQFVPSHSTSPSYIVEGIDIEERTFEALRLEIDLRERRGRILWQGELERKLGGREKLALQRDVDALLGRLPATRAK